MATHLESDFGITMPPAPVVPVDQRAKFLKSAPNRTIIEAGCELYEKNHRDIWKCYGDLVDSNPLGEETIIDFEYIEAEKLEGLIGGSDIYVLRFG